MAVFETDFYSESMVSIKCRTCVNGTRATRLMAPVPASESGSDNSELLWELTPFSESWFLLPSHLTSCPFSGGMPLLFQGVLTISFLISWHPFWTMVVRGRGGWREGVFGFTAMSHFRVFGTLTGWLSLTQTSREKHNNNSKISFTKDSDCKPCTRH